MKFSAKLSILLLSITVSVVAVVSFVAYTLSHKALEKQIDREMQSYAAGTLDTIDRTLFERIAAMKVLSTDSIISSPESTPKQIATRLIEYRNEYKTYTSLSFFDLNRIRIADTSGLKLGKQHKSTLRFQNALGKELRFNIAMSESLKIPVITFTSLVKDKNGEAFGLVVARMPLSKLHDLIAPKLAGHTHDDQRKPEGPEGLEIDLIDADGLLLYSNYNRKGILKDNLLEHKEFKAILIAEDEAITTIRDPLEGDTYFCVHAHEHGHLDFPGSGWAMIVRVPVEVAFAPVIQLRNAMAAISITIVVIAIAASLIFSRTISRPITKLRDAAIEIGKGNLEARIEVKSNDEIGELAASFNEMAGKLKESHLKLKESHKQLEEKVQERTAELSSSNATLEGEVEQRTSAQKTLEERIKELKCLFGLSKLIEQPGISLEQIFEETGDLIHNAYQESDKTCVRITFEGVRYKTDNFKKSELSQYAPIEVRGDKAGAIEVYYLGEKAENGQSSFLKEECDLLDTIAEHLGRIAERKKTGEKLQLFRNLIDQSNDSIFLLEPKWGRFLDVNDRACESLGHTREELLEMGVKDIEEVIPDDSAWTEHVKEVRKKGYMVLEGRHKRKDGTTFPVEINVKFIEQEKDSYMLAVARDITERKRAEEKQAKLFEQVESINQELKDFAYIVSHDLKAPLRGIKTLADWISTDYADKLDEQGREQMNLLSSRVDRMHNLIDGVLQYSRVGRVKEEQIQVNLNELVPDVIDTVAPPENIEITVENEMPVVECGETRIMQVFQNLLSNAVKYTDKPQGRIKIGCVEEDGFWKFSVADNGPGIEEKHFGKIFRIFQTLSPRDEVESTGVGLSVVKKIVELYGGKIWVESKPGEGSTFFFTLPKPESEVANDTKLEANIVS